MRPQSIVWFERIAIAKAALTIIIASLLGPFIFYIILCSFELVPAIFVSRGRMKMMMWIIVIEFFIGIPFVLATLASAYSDGAWSSFGGGSIGLLISSIQLSLLIAVSSRRWLDGEGDDDEYASAFE